MPLLATAVLALTMMQGAENVPAAPTAPYTTLSERLDSWFSVLHLHKALPKPKRHDDSIKHRFWTGNGWTVIMRDDGFTGQKACQVHPSKMFSKSRITYTDGVMGFRFDHYVNPQKAWFRVDDQPARPWLSVFRDLYDKGLNVVPYDNGTEKKTEVLIPIEDLAGAQKVAIRPTPQGEPDTFDISGYQEAVDASRRLGCPEGNYTRHKF